jgi:uncharacterized protein (DUF608 family)
VQAEATIKLYDQLLRGSVPEKWYQQNEKRERLNKQIKGLLSDQAIDPSEYAEIVIAGKCRSSLYSQMYFGDDGQFIGLEQLNDQKIQAEAERQEEAAYEEWQRKWLECTGGHSFETLLKGRFYAAIARLRNDSITDPHEGVRIQLKQVIDTIEAARKAAYEKIYTREFKGQLASLDNPAAVKKVLHKTIVTLIQAKLNKQAYSVTQEESVLQRIAFAMEGVQVDRGAVDETSIPRRAIAVGIAGAPQ